MTTDLLTIAGMMGVAVGVARLAEWLNRGQTRIIHAAEAEVRRRLDHREHVAPESILEASGIPADLAGPAMDLLRGLSQVIGIDPGRLRPDDVLGDLLRVGRNDLPEVSARDWEKAEFHEFVEVHSYDIMYLVEQHSDWKRWRENYNQMANPPRNEEEWIDLIMSMTMSEFLSTFAPMSKAL